ncbi:MAG: MBL fold metallo-hydrolase [Defluviitaleaceae bacterium]|nr:MBL fold metallo-hydrolase [Defluviitaleaceae bacterium]
MQIQQIKTRNTIFTANESADGTVCTGIIRGKEHNFIIDTGTGGEFAKAMIDHLGDDPLPTIVINTHSHWDHVYGNWMFKGKEIIAHKFCAELLDNDWANKINELKERGSYLLGDIYKHLPNRLIDAPLHFAADGVLIFMNPGHSKDSISVYDEVDKILYLGDNFGIDEDDDFCYWGYEFTEEDEAEDADEDEVEARYDASFFEMMKLLKTYDFEGAVISHGGYVSREQFRELEREFEEE